MKSTRTNATVRISGATSAGCVRTNNEDSFHIDETYRFAVVADGIGGSEAGEIASRLGVEVISKELRRRLSKLLPDNSTSPDLSSLVRDVLTIANAQVCETAETNSQWSGMGTTVALLLIYGNRACVANSGDSRVYLYRDASLQQLTQDHTSSAIAERFFAASESTVGKASPTKSSLTQSLGKDPQLFLPFISELEIVDDDAFILCTDGLTDLIEDSELNRLLRPMYSNPGTVAAALVKVAKDRGGIDNVTVVGIAVEGIRPSSATIFWRNVAIGVTSVLGLALIGVFLVSRTHWVRHSPAAIPEGSKVPGIAPPPPTASMKATASVQNLKQDAETIIKLAVDAEIAATDARSAAKKTREQELLAYKIDLVTKIPPIPETNASAGASNEPKNKAGTAAERANLKASKASEMARGFASDAVADTGRASDAASQAIERYQQAFGIPSLSGNTGVTPPGTVPADQSLAASARDGLSRALRAEAVAQAAADAAKEAADGTSIEAKIVAERVEQAFHKSQRNAPVH